MEPKTPSSIEPDDPSIDPSPESVATPETPDIPSIDSDQTVAAPSLTDTNDEPSVTLSSSSVPDSDIAPEATPASSFDSTPTPVTATPDAPVTATEPDTTPVISQTFTPSSSASVPPPPFTPSTTPSASATPTDPSISASPTESAGPAVSGQSGIFPPSQNVVVGGPSAGVVSSAAPTASRKKLPKKFIASVVALIVIVGGAAGFYFGYYMNPNVIYSQGLKNTGTGYDRLVTFADQQSKLANKGYTSTGSYSVKTSGFETDGKVAFKGDGGANNDLTFDVGLAGNRINADVRTIKSDASTPDLYLKADGIEGLGTVIGVPALDPDLAKINNQWIVIDHTLLDSYASSAGSSDSSKVTGPTRAQIIDEARAFGEVSKQYLLSTAKDKAVTKVVRKYGVETVDGHKTYHYQVVLQKDNVKKYILAQRDALKASTLNDWLKKNKYDKTAYDSLTDAANSTKDIKSSDTYDIWMDMSQRIIYKVRFSGKENPAENYTDVGLDYKGGDSFPFFLAGKSKDSTGTTTFRLSVTVNTKSGDIGVKLNASEPGSDGATVTANSDIKPNTTAVKIAKPDGAVPLSQVMSELGFDSSELGADSTTTDAGIAQQTRNNLSASASGKTTPPASISQNSLLQRLFKQ